MLKQVQHDESREDDEEQRGLTGVVSLCGARPLMTEYIVESPPVTLKAVDLPAMMTHISSLKVK